VLSTLRPDRCYQHGAAGPWQVVTPIVGSKRLSLLMAGDDDEMFMTRSLNVTSKTTEQHFIVRSNKSLAIHCARRFVLLELTTDRHEASCGLFAIAELLVSNLVMTVQSIHPVDSCRPAIYQTARKRRPATVTACCARR